MFFEKHDNLAAMRQIIKDEITNSQRMIQLCREDSRLGYHSEAEGYLFYPEKLEARIKLLGKVLLECDNFTLNSPVVMRYTGELPEGIVAIAGTRAGEKMAVGDHAFWQVWHDHETLYVRCTGANVFQVEIEPCRLWPAIVAKLDKNGKFNYNKLIFRVEPNITIDNNTIRFPLEIFDGYRRKKFPMRINISTPEASWASGKPYPARLLHDTFNPARAGWLFIK